MHNRSKNRPQTVWFDHNGICSSLNNYAFQSIAPLFMFLCECPRRTDLIVCMCMHPLLYICVWICYCMYVYAVPWFIITCERKSAHYGCVFPRTLIYGHIHSEYRPISHLVMYQHISIFLGRIWSTHMYVLVYIHMHHLLAVEEIEAEMLVGFEACCMHMPKRYACMYAHNIWHVYVCMQKRHARIYAHSVLHVCVLTRDVCVCIRLYTNMRTYIQTHKYEHV